MKNKGIIIAGAGLAGLTAAANLARAGYQVKVYEKKNFIGQHLKETVQLLPNWFSKKNVIKELEECGIKINWLNKLEEIEIYLGNTKIIIYSKRDPIGYTVLRGGDNSLEKDLAKQAREAGVNIITGKETEERPDIVATGLGKILTVGYGQVYKGEFEPNKAKVFLGLDCSPSVGYGYLFPHYQQIATFKISKKIGETADLKKNLEKIRERYLNEKLKKENFLYDFGTKRSFEIPKTAVIDGSFLVGEAAGFQDELFRFGMRYAVISGYLAAKAIIENLDYDKLWKKRFSAEFRKTARVRRIFTDFKKKSLNLLPKDFGFGIEIEKFKKIWLFPGFSKTMALYPFCRPFVFNRFFLQFILKNCLRFGLLTNRTLSD